MSVAEEVICALLDRPCLNLVKKANYKSDVNLNHITERLGSNFFLLHKHNLRPDSRLQTGGDPTGITPTSEYANTAYACLYQMPVHSRHVREDVVHMALDSCVSNDRLVVGRNVEGFSISRPKP